MNFPNDSELNALVGRLCLVLASVEQTVGRATTAADGNWDVEGSPEYLSRSSESAVLDRWLRNVSRAYPEVRSDINRLRRNLDRLRTERNRWAHSSAGTDLFLLMAEEGRTSQSDQDVVGGRLLHGKGGGHIEPPTDADVDEFVVRASAVGDAAQALGETLAALAGAGVRPVVR